MPKFIILTEKYSTPSKAIMNYFNQHPDIEAEYFDLGLMKGLIENRFIYTTRNLKEAVYVDHKNITPNDLLNTNKRLLDLNNIVKNLTINEIKSLKENNKHLKLIIEGLKPC